MASTLAKEDLEEVSYQDKQAKNLIGPEAACGGLFKQYWMLEEEKAKPSNVKTMELLEMSGNDVL